GQGRRGGEDDDDEARGGGGDRGEAERVDQGGDGQDAAAAPERAQRDTDEGARGQGEKERTHATVPLPSRPGGRGKDGTGAVTCRPAREVGAPSWDGRVGYPARGPCAASAAGRAGAQGCLRRVVIPVVLLRQACVVVRPARSAPSKPPSTATTSRPAASSRDAAIAARMPPAQCTQTWPSGISASRPPGCAAGCGPIPGRTRPRVRRRGGRRGRRPVRAGAGRRGRRRRPAGRRRAS